MVRPLELEPKQLGTFNKRPTAPGSRGIGNHFQNCGWWVTQEKGYFIPSVSEHVPPLDVRLVLDIEVRLVVAMLRAQHGFYKLPEKRSARPDYPSCMPQMPE